MMLLPGSTENHEDQGRCLYELMWMVSLGSVLPFPCPACRSHHIHMDHHGEPNSCSQRLWWKYNFSCILMLIIPNMTELRISCETFHVLSSRRIVHISSNLQSRRTRLCENCVGMALNSWPGLGTSRNHPPTECWGHRPGTRISTWDRSKESWQFNGLIMFT